MNAKLDVQTLKTLPLVEVIELAMLGDILSLQYGDREAGLARVGAFAPELRHLFWLTVLADGMAYPEGHGLSHFLEGKPGDFAPQVRIALEEADFKPEAQVLAGAMALFGETYPIEEGTRERFFASCDAQTHEKVFENKIGELSKRFWSKEAFWQQIADYVRRTPALLAWVENARANIDEAQRLRWLQYALARAAPKDPSQLKAWPKAHRLLYLLGTFNREMLNGGVHQFFYNSSGDWALEVVEALKEVKLQKHAEAVQQGIESFGPSYPTDNWTRRENHFDDHDWNEWDDRLSELTGCVDDGEIHKAMLHLANTEGILPA